MSPSSHHIQDIFKNYILIKDGLMRNEIFFLLLLIAFRAHRGFWSDLLHSLLLDFLQTCSSSAESPLLSASDPVHQINCHLFHTDLYYTSKDTSLLNSTVNREI